MDWLFIIFGTFAALLLQIESKPLLLDADYTDDDLLAEESHAFAQAISSAYGSSVASASSSSFGGFGYGAPLVCHPHHTQPHQHHFHQPAAFPPFFPQPGFGNPHFMPQPQPPPHHNIGQQPNFHGNRKPSRGVMRPIKPMMPNKTKKPNPVPTTSAPKSTVSTLKPIQQETGTTARSTSLPVSTTVPTLDTGSTSTTTEEPTYDIDIRFDN